MPAAESRSPFPVFKAALVVLVVAAGAAWTVRRHLGQTAYLGRDGVVMQRAANECGAAALKMIFDSFGVAADYELVRARLRMESRGTTMLCLKEAAETFGLLCEGWRLAPQDLPALPVPAILRVRGGHFVVLAAMDAAQGTVILDPARGRLRVSRRRLLSIWAGETLLFAKPGDLLNRRGRWFRSSLHQ